MKKMNNEKKLCGFGCGRKWDEQGEFECVSQYHRQDSMIQERMVALADFCRRAEGVGFTPDQALFLSQFIGRFQQDSVWVSQK